MISIREYKKRVDDTGDELPLLTLDEFFAGNSDEDAIAPNQVNEGRPKIAEIYEKFKSLEKHDDIAWIRVLLHDDTKIIEDGDNEKITLYGESILICTDFSPEEIECLVDCEWLKSDGVSELELDEFINTYPEISEGFRCFEVMWD